jgi:sec-independent protein translocase protein TatA
MQPLFALGMSPLGLVVILVVVLLLFGNRLPQLMRSLGRSVVEFKGGLNEGQIEDDSQSDSKAKT